VDEIRSEREQARPLLRAESALRCPLHESSPSPGVHQFTEGSLIGARRLPEVQVFHPPPSKDVTRLYDAGRDRKSAELAECGLASGLRHRTQVGFIERSIGGDLVLEVSDARDLDCAPFVNKYDDLRVSDEAIFPCGQHAPALEEGVHLGGRNGSKLARSQPQEIPECRAHRAMQNRTILGRSQVRNPACKSRRSSVG